LFFGFQRTSRLNEQYLLVFSQQYQVMNLTEKNASLGAITHRLLNTVNDTHYPASSHLVILAAMTIYTLRVLRKLAPTSLRWLQTGSTLIIIMTLASPVFQSHHALLFIPALMLQLINASPARLMGLFLVCMGLFMSATLDHSLSSYLLCGSAWLLWGMQLMQVKGMGEQVIPMRQQAETAPLKQIA
jgi:hypothetical protein